MWCVCVCVVGVGGGGGGGGGGQTITYLLKLLPQDVTHVQRIEHVRESIMCND